MSFDQLYAINHTLDQRYPDGRDPFKIMTRLLEECGELAAVVNWIEDQGVKRQKLGEPSPAAVVPEIQDILRCVLQVAAYYKVEHLLAADISAAHKKLCS